MEMISNEEKITQAVLVSVDTGDYDAEASLAELKELVKRAELFMFTELRGWASQISEQIFLHRSERCSCLSVTE